MYTETRGLALATLTGLPSVAECVDDDRDPGEDACCSRGTRLTEAESGWGNSGSLSSSDSVPMKTSIPRKQGMVVDVTRCTFKSLRPSRVRVKVEDWDLPGVAARLSLWGSMC